MICVLRTVVEMLKTRKVDEPIVRISEELNAKNTLIIEANNKLTNGIPISESM